MAIYHLSVKTISRSAGRSAVAAAAYRAGEKLTDERQGIEHDYTRKQGVEASSLVLPDDAPEWAANRNTLWNAAESVEKRKNSVVAREIEIALPVELSAKERQELVLEFAREIVNKHGCAVDVAIHAPSRDGDDRNHHAHLLLTTRRLEENGFGEKTRELDQGRGENGAVEHWRMRWENLSNTALERAGREERLDRRSHKSRGIETPPTLHQGAAITQIERREKREAGKMGGVYKPVTDLGHRNQQIRLAEHIKPSLDAFREMLKRGAAAAAILAKIGQDIVQKQREKAAAERERAQEAKRRLQRLAEEERERAKWEKDRGHGLGR